MRLGIDASNIGGGGGITHLKELLDSISRSTDRYCIKNIVVFGSLNTLNEIINDDFITKITFTQLNGSLLERIYFQVFHYDKEIQQRCDILFSIAGDYFGSFKPLVGMSRNMLLYERDIWREIKKPIEILRFWLNFQKQKICFKNSEGIIFISEYAKQYANNVLTIDKINQIIIPHGVSNQFKGEVKVQKDISFYSQFDPFNFLYVSTVHVYKNQWNVVKAISNLRQRGIPVTLTLVGGVLFKKSGELLDSTINDVDPYREFIFSKGHIPYAQIAEEYRNAAGIVFASHCENMPNILIESMASGVPILCSNKSPMPEFLKENGFYFNPKNVQSIEDAMLEFLFAPERREIMARNNIEEIKKYSWEITSNQTFKFLSDVYLENL